MEDLMERTLRDRISGNNPNVTSHKVRDIILHNPLRQYFISAVKAPLVKAIISLANKYPKPTSDNLDTANAQVLRDAFGKFHKHNKVKPDMFLAVERIAVGEVEHDPVYGDFLQIFLEFIIEAILAGKWKPRRLGKPAPRYWSETPPYGGENSIIYKLMQHKDEIKSILEREK